MRSLSAIHYCMAFGRACQSSGPNVVWQLSCPCINPAFATAELVGELESVVSCIEVLY